eukprot:TRINITY_DN73764_c0_g1_i1.p1 TRINITY_DN73764_c0_g1~~TRINITY_DN73764_c0_g1_i1.p1  ORF type:complete len:636 (-),score=126.69 TRINITY_DN73764_c0_g1_i1:146-2053(-)
MLSEERRVPLDACSVDQLLGETGHEADAALAGVLADAERDAQGAQRYRGLVGELKEFLDGSVTRQLDEISAKLNLLCESVHITKDPVPLGGRGNCARTSAKCGGATAADAGSVKSDNPDKQDRKDAPRPPSRPRDRSKREQTTKSKTSKGSEPVCQKNGDAIKGERSPSKTIVDQSDLDEAKKILEQSMKMARPQQRLNKKAPQWLREMGDESKQKSLLVRTVENPTFNMVSAIAILLNSILIGAETQWNVENIESSVIIDTFSHIFSVYFCTELVLRLTAMPYDFIFGENMTWNAFDSLLVLLSIVDAFILLIMGDGVASIGSSMKMIKMLRIIRLFRMFRFFRQLSLIALMIIESLKALFWAIILLGIILYFFAIIFTQVCTDHVRTVPDSRVTVDIANQFGSLHVTIYSLIMAMLGGVSWGVLTDTLLAVSIFPVALFFFYITFTMLAVLNIITGVFVDNAMEMASSQREVQVERELQMRENFAEELRGLFDMMDGDGSGSLNLEELNEFLRDLRVRSYFVALGLDVEDTERLFKLIDSDDSGEVGIQEFLDGCLRIKGEAKSIDIQGILAEVRRLSAKVDLALGGHGPPSRKTSRISGHSAVSCPRDSWIEAFKAPSIPTGKAPMMPNCVP